MSSAQSQSRRVPDKNFAYIQRISRAFSSQPPQVSAMSWSIVNATNGDELASKTSYDRVEIASLTKIMTAYVVLQIQEQLALKPSDITVKVPRVAVMMGGTSAFLKLDDVLSVYDLLNGLLLPSGNDAALALANWGGEQLKSLSQQRKEEIFSKSQGGSRNKNYQLRKLKPSKQNEQQERDTGILLSDYDFIKMEKDQQKNSIDASKKKFSIELTSDMSNKLQHEDEVQFNILRFVKEMNAYALRLNLKDTQFSNAHGLADKANKSTCRDISRLCTYILKNEYIRKIIATKRYQCDTLRTSYVWFNTNILLRNQFCLGIKTGYTPNAGGCLAVLYDLIKLNRNRSSSMQMNVPNKIELDGYIIIILLGSRDQNKRFTETEKLINWMEGSVFKSFATEQKETSINSIPLIKSGIPFKHPKSANNYLRQGSFEKNPEKKALPPFPLSKNIIQSSQRKVVFP